jgi:cellobiose epimerase
MVSTAVCKESLLKPLPEYPKKSDLKKQLEIYGHELRKELHRILHWWMQYALDEEQGGFHGAVSSNNTPDKTAKCGLILNARILWSFAAAAQLTGNTEYATVARRQLDYLNTFFFDPEFGGYYEAVQPDGQPHSRVKNITAQAYMINALSAYASLSGCPQTLDSAAQLFRLVEQHAFDTLENGYAEAFTQQWQALPQQAKTATTQLHLLEAYAGLYAVQPGDLLKGRLQNLLRLFADKLVHSVTGHLQMEFTAGWQPTKTVISYGHDIETSWLLTHAAETIGDIGLQQQVQSVTLRMVRAASKGLDKDGGLWCQYRFEDNRLIDEKHWWPQTEAMLGFFNAYELSGDADFARQSMQVWQFVKHHLLDTQNGEWFWGIDRHYAIMDGEDKAGYWKCPYHNTRVCLQLLQRIGKMKAAAKKTVIIKQPDSLI